MRIGVDAHVLSGKFQGSRTYLLNLYRHVLRNQQQNEYIFFGHWDEELPYGEDVRYVPFKSGSRIRRLTFETHPLLVANNIHWYHTTYISPLRVPCRTVVTIHDILFETHPQYFTKQEVWRNRWFVRRSAHKAEQIHTVSEYSKQALIRLYGVPEHKIHIVPNGVDLHKFTSEGKAESIRRIRELYGVENYLLMVGRIEPRKNHITLLKAYKKLQDMAVSAGPLVIVGRPDFQSKPFFDAIEELGLQNSVHVIESVGDEELPHMYRGAKLFVYPSYAEGFGIPIIEAMACGVPVVTSNTTAMPEVVGNAGLLADPHSPELLALAMFDMLANDRLREEFSVKGVIQAQKWTWDRAADAYLEAIQTLDAGHARGAENGR